MEQIDVCLAYDLPIEEVDPIDIEVCSFYGYTCDTCPNHFQA